jgi:hypothetical protein
MPAEDHGADLTTRLLQTFSRFGGGLSQPQMRFLPPGMIE